MRARFVLALLVIAAAPAHAANRCTMPGGQVVYQDAPCPSAATGGAVKTWGNTPGNFVAGERRAQTNPAPAAAQPMGGAVGIGASSEPVPESASLLALYRRWADADVLAASTARIALPGPIATMQALRRDVQDAAVPECLRGAKRMLGDLVGQAADAYIAFLGKTGTGAYDRDRLAAAFQREVRRAPC